jgi:D-tyrosyl-tRNA(Tyr) deacylase
VKAVVQRVSRAAVHIDDEVAGEIGRGMVILVGVMRGDGEAEARRLARKIAHFRFFEDEQGRMNLSALDLELGVLVVSQFTLAADGRRGRRPSFDRAAPPAEAEPLYECFVHHLREIGLTCATGRFGARMRVELENDGPVTFALEEVPDLAARPAPGP